MQGIEEAAMRRNGINAITKVISGVTDDMLSAMNSMGIIRRREYNLSDIASSNEKIEEFYKDYGDGNVISSWDKVTTFYNKQGKKLFKFGLAYDNIQLLVKEVKNTQKKYFKSEKERNRTIGSYGGENNNERKDISDSLRNNPLLDKHIKPECNYPCLFAGIDR